MKKTVYLLLTFLTALTAVAQTKKDVYDSYNKLTRLLMYIDGYYVDSADIPRLTEKAIHHMLHHLDPHSSYIPAEDVQSANEEIEGNFEGVGIEFAILNDTLTVAAPIAGGPSEAVGIRAGDRIVTVDSLPVAGIGLKNERVLKLLRGAKGTVVKLTVVRKNVAAPLVFTVVRDKIPIHSVDAVYEVQPGVAYIRLGRFSMTSLAEMNEGLKKIKRPPTAILLDLRGNSGGVLKTAIDLCNQFLEEGRLIVYNEGTHWPKSMEIATGDGFFKKGKLVVLIDEGAASASEIVSGAIQDWDRGIIIGRRSFGKGLVQQLLPLPDGSQLRLTVARYHTPTGRVIQRPYDAGNVEKYYADLYKRFQNGEIYNRDSIRFPDSLKYSTLVHGRAVYGGGGIMPDIFMPADTAAYSDYYQKIYRAGLFRQFITQRVDKERGNLRRQYKTFADFDSRFQVDDALFEQFVAYAEAHQIPREEAGLALSGNHIRVQLKALIARSLWGMDAYFETVNKRIDPVFLKAIDVINHWDYYEKEYLRTNEKL